MDKYRMEVERERKGNRGENTGARKVERRITIHLKVVALVVVMLVVGFFFDIKDVLTEMEYTFAENKGILVVGAIIIAIGLVLKFISKKTGYNFNDKKYFNASSALKTPTPNSNNPNDMWNI
ncbi:MAG: hypothetical protein C4550_02700 [Nitrospiraceae bacterium]|nr:MAG: hypothetical protein C4550_02700 [Nitrospiraceae bacterium]